MKVVVSSISKFHAFSLAQELDKRAHLERLLVSYFNPRTNAKGYHFDKEKLTRNIIPFAIDRLPWKISAFGFLRGRTSYLSRECYDCWARARLPECDIFVGWSSYSLHTLRKAKQKYGAVSVLERGSCHIVTQTELLTREYADFGMDIRPTSPRIIAKELREYDETDYVAIASDFVRKSFVERGYPEHKLIQVPYGVDLGNFHDAGKDDSVFRVMHLGSTVRKGTHYLLKAWNELDLPNSQLLLVGSIEDPIKPLLAKASDSVEYFPNIPHTELHRYYSRSSVYVLPSIEDGFGLVIPEAMACGTPVLCSSNVGAADLVREGVDGFVVPVRDVEALKEKLLWFYDNESRRRDMGESAIERVHQFTWDRYGEKTVEQYRRILGRQEG